MQLLAGIFRKLSIPLVVLSVLGWILFIIGFATYNFSDAFENRQDAAEGTVFDDGRFEDHRADIWYFPYWFFMVAAPVMYINLILHLIIGRWFTGLVTNVLVALHLVMGGAVLYNCGLLILSEDTFDEDHITDEDVNLYLLIEWVGCLASVFFLTAHMVMWPLFSEPKRNDGI